MSILSLRSMGTRLRAIAAVFACTLISPVFAAPYKPSDANEVLLQIDPSQQSARNNLRGFDRSDARAAVKVAENFVALGRAQHDERYFGYASAALQPWQSNRDAPNEILLLQADVAQYQHRFDDALRILDVLIARDPNSTSGRLMRATIRMTQGRPQLARPDCQRLFGLRETFAGAICLAQAASLSGQLSASYRLVGDLTARDSADTENKKNTSQLTWALGVAAEMAERLRDFSAAETHLRRALKLTPDDFPTRLQLCDLLLQLRRPGEALQLIAAFTPSDPILLRRALATKQIGNPSQAREALAAWQAAVERSSQLGVTLHLRELARGQLELLKKPEAALETALANWEVQREPIDARLLADAARTARNKDAMALIRDWQRNLKFEDARLVL